MLEVANPKMTRIDEKGLHQHLPGLTQLIIYLNASG
jgi:hypothetical protein